MSVTRNVDGCKLPIKIVHVRVSLSRRKTGFGVLIGVDLIFCKINGKFSSYSLFLSR